MVFGYIEIVYISVNLSSDATCTPDSLAREHPNRRADILDFLEPLMLRAYEVYSTLRLLLVSFQTCTNMHVFSFAF